MVVMSNGTKVLDGPPEEVLSDERAESFGVLVPPVAKLYSLLAEDGVTLGRLPLTPQELAEELRARQR